MPEQKQNTDTPLKLILNELGHVTAHVKSAAAKIDQLVPDVATLKTKMDTLLHRHAECSNERKTDHDKIVEAETKDKNVYQPMAKRVDTMWKAHLGVGGTLALVLVSGFMYAMKGYVISMIKFCIGA